MGRNGRKTREMLVRCIVHHTDATEDDSGNHGLVAGTTGWRQNNWHIHTVKKHSQLKHQLIVLLNQLEEARPHL